MSSEILAALAAAVAALPDDVGLRVRYAQQLLIAGKRDDAIAQAKIVLEADPNSVDAAAVVREATQPAPPSADDIDWTLLEQQLDTPVLAPFVELIAVEDGLYETAPTDPAMEVSREKIRLDDVGGLAQVKKRINEAFLEPMRHPEIAKAFGKSLRGGLVLYGPPGCGKTYVARAIAGELNARFVSVTISDILDKFFGESERNMHAVFERARELAPAVLFFDELDAIGGRRSSSSQTGAVRNIVNQMLMEMDGVDSANEGLFVLGATNHPWDVDSALLRPGRFDRMILVLPPDEPARQAILRVHLSGRPVEGMDLAELAARTEGYSGADLEHICATASEKAMMESIRTGEVRPVNMNDMRLALKEVKSSIGPWLQSARNVALHGNQSGQYDELADYLREKKLL